MVENLGPLLLKSIQREKLFGQSIRFTKKALLLEPNDRDAIAIQGEYLWQLAFPFKLVADYSFNAIPPIRSALDGQFLVSYAAFKAHYSLFPASEQVVAELGDDIRP